MTQSQREFYSLTMLRKLTSERRLNQYQANYYMNNLYNSCVHKFLPHMTQTVAIKYLIQNNILIECFKQKYSSIIFSFFSELV